jgi:molybdenum cofactor biosynthesis protein B
MAGSLSRPSDQDSAHDHKTAAPASISCMVITCSDTRTRDTDTSGAAIQALLQSSGHRVAGYHLVKDDPNLIRNLIQQGAQDPAVQAIIINGGTGISRRDSTFEAVDSLLEKRLDGFGEIFRYLSFAEIGAAAIMSRATAGLYRDRIVISIPGSEKAVRLAMEQLILHELGHMVREMTK